MFDLSNDILVEVRTSGRPNASAVRNLGFLVDTGPNRSGEILDDTAMQTLVPAAALRSSLEADSCK